MTVTEPVTALSGARTGNICDQCNKGVRTGDLVKIYATFYEDDGWVLRRMWCDECGSTTIEPETAGADEVTAEAVFWDHRLVSVDVLDRSSPRDGGEQ